MVRHAPQCMVLAVAFVTLAAVPLSADVIRLKNGGELRGAIQNAPGAASRTNDEKADVVLRTLSGAKVVVGRAQIESIERRPLNIEEYERRARTVADDVESRWALAEWCRSRNLKAQREEQLEQILELDPGHEKAHYGLGHTKIDGQWAVRDEVLRERGYISYKGRYVSAEEKAMLERAAANREAELKWFKTIRLWHSWLKNSDPERNRKGLDEFQRLNDPDAIAALTNFLWKDDNEKVRQLYVLVLKRMPGNDPVPLLVQAALYDTSATVRGDALEAITPDRHQAAFTPFVRGLASPENAVVGRSAVALRKLGNPDAIPALIESLVTTHRYKVRVADTSSSYSFTTNGGFGNPNAVQLPPEVAAGLLTGQYPNGVIIDRSNQPPPRTRIVTVQREEKNPEVLAALESLTGEQHGYDEHMWRLWWDAQKSGGGKFSNLP